MEIDNLTRWAEATAHVHLNTAVELPTAHTRAGEPFAVDEVKMHWEALRGRWSHVRAEATGHYLHADEDRGPIRTGLVMHRDYGPAEPHPGWLVELVTQAVPTDPPPQMDDAPTAPSGREDLEAIAAGLVDVPLAGLHGLFVAARQREEMLTDLQNGGVDVSTDLALLRSARAVLRDLMGARRNAERGRDG